MSLNQCDDPIAEGSLAEPGGEIALAAGAELAHEPTLTGIKEHPLREMVTIAAPTIATMTSYTVMQFIDAQMVLRIGPEPVYVAAQGNGGMLAWLFIAIVLGMTGVVNSYVSQNLGAGRPREGAAYAWNAMWISALGWAVLMVPMIFLCPMTFAALGHDDELRRLEDDYAQIMLFGGLFTTMARALGHYFYGMHRPVVVMVAVIAANLINVLANWILIFGHWGAPALGVAGAAIGTVLGTLVELVGPFLVFIGPRYAREFSTRVAWRPSLRHIRDIARIGWPGSLMFFNDMVCWGYLMVGLIPKAAQAAGQDPVVANTAGWIGFRFMHLSFMPTVGLSIALTAIVGKCMGMRRPDLAASRTWLGMRLGLAYMGLCAIAFFLFREQLVSLFIEKDTPPEARTALIAIGSQIIIAAALFQLFDAIQILLSGALRGAGDTIWPGILTVVCSWTFIVAGGHLLIWRFPDLGAISPWIGGASFIISLGCALLFRFTQGNWRTMRLVHDSDAGPDSAGPTSGLADA
ncbi:MAG: MATE family efflux transporter [Phycisphaeraceae bacterium]|nr:MAG: MATE family efflux transporter [Phycisphaeraceae bacterium]